MNPRPKTVSNGLYILIPNFKFYWSVSSGMDTDQYSLKNLTGKGSGTLFKRSRIVDALYQNLQEESRQDGSCLKLLQRNYNRLRLLFFPPVLRDSRKLGMQPKAS